LAGNRNFARKGVGELSVITVSGRDGLAQSLPKDKKTASIFPGRTGQRGGAARDHDFALSPCTGVARADQANLQFDQPVGRTVTAAASGNHGGRDHHRGAEFDQERQRDPRPEVEADSRGPQLSIRDEVAHWSGPAWYRSNGESDRRQRSRDHAAAVSL